MAITLAEKLASLSTERQNAIAARAGVLRNQYITLQALRQARDLTQIEMAAQLGVAQATVAKTEKRTDMMLSTMRNYVQAMGGTLTLTVEFPDQEPVILGGLGDVDDISGTAKP